MCVRVLLSFSKKTVASVVVALTFLMVAQTAFAQDALPRFFRKKEYPFTVKVNLLSPGHLINAPSVSLSSLKLSLPLIPLNEKLGEPTSYDSGIVSLQKTLATLPKDAQNRAHSLFQLIELYVKKTEAYVREVSLMRETCSGGKCKQAIDLREDEVNRLRQKVISLCREFVNSYQKSEHLDAVLFYLAANLQELGRQDESIEYYKELYQKFSQSKFIPNVLVAFGDYHYYKNDMDSALKAYDRVQPGSSLYAYAQYKKAWCYFDLDQKDRTLAILLDVLKLAQKDKDNPTSKGLIQQTLKGIVKVYSLVGEPNGALKFFKKVAPNGDEWLKLTEQLAVLYSNQTKTEQANTVYNELIEQNKNTWKVLNYQYEIIANQMANNPYSLEEARAVVFLLYSVQKVDQGENPGKNDPEYKAIRKKIEQFVRSEIIRYHREAQATRSDDLYVIALNLYKYYFATFPNGLESYTLTFFYGEVLSRREKWEEAAKMYEKALQLEPKGVYTRGIVEGLIRAYYELLVGMGSSLTDLMQKLDGEITAKDDSVPQPKKIPERIQRLIDLCKLYERIGEDLNTKPADSVKSTGWRPEFTDMMINAKFIVALEYYMFAHFNEAISRLKQIVQTYPTHQLAISAALMQLQALAYLHEDAAYKEAIDGYLSSQSPIKDKDFLAILRKKRKMLQSK